MTQKALPAEITSYDLLKTLALILMIIDHTGHFFFPYVASAQNVEVIWFRVLGRFCIPIWFFLIGYAQTKDIPPRLWAGAVLTLLGAMIAGGVILPLNILFTIMIARYIRDGVVRKTLEKPEHMRGMFFLLAFGTLPTSLAFEYGSIIMLFVVFGHIRRHPESITMDKKYIHLFVFLSFFLFLLMQGLTIRVLTVPQMVSLFAGFAVVGALLWSFRPMTYPRLTRALGPLQYLLKLTGRRTLEIYVLHLIVFRGLAMYFYPDQHVFWGWKIAEPGLVSMVVQ
ncbi:MAG: hypothetical protein KDI61_03030 [Alphaproteobacteria bacterium]|nr:hypothetical protein [Alphaproteobacteria bacterium]MCB1839225.1 hypothetical protein [Alphaproteobacteria bacterium]